MLKNTQNPPPYPRRLKRVSIKAGLLARAPYVSSSLPEKLSVAYIEKTSTYSGGTASEYHRFPFSLYISKEPLYYSVDFIIHENKKSRLPI